MKKRTVAVALGLAVLLASGCGGGGSTGSGQAGNNGNTGSAGQNNPGSGGGSPNAGSNPASGDQIAQLMPITTKTVCDPAKSSNPPYTDLKYNAEGGNIAIECNPDSMLNDGIDVSFKDGSASVNLKKIHVEQYDNKFGLMHTKTFYDYTPDAFTITYFHGRDMQGKMVQESCTRTYNPPPLSDADPIAIQTILATPYTGNLAGEVNTTCDDSILSFGDRIDNPDTGNSLIQRNFTFTPVTGEETKIYREETSKQGS